jgi:hypothetical protein
MTMDAYIEALVFRAVIVAALTAFVQIVMSKIGGWDWLQYRSRGIVYRMLDCEFCRGFWIGVILTLPFCLSCPGWIIVPLLSAPISRALL